MFSVNNCYMHLVCLFASLVSAFFLLPVRQLLNPPSFFSLFLVFCVCWSQLGEGMLNVKDIIWTLMHWHMQLAMNKRAEENKFWLYDISGSETLGSILRVQPCSDESVELPKCSFQWYRLSSECSRREPILGADKFVYAPEPIDVGRVLQVDILANGQKISVTATGPIEPAAGLANYVETLQRKANFEFSVIVAQMNGRNYSSHSAHSFHVGKTRMKLCKGWITKARDSYSKSMQLCGFRGGGNSAAKSLYWQPRKGQTFVLVFENERERNGALVLARKYAYDCNVILAGPDDDALL